MSYFLEEEVTSAQAQGEKAVLLVPAPETSKTVLRLSPERRKRESGAMKKKAERQNKDARDR